MDISAPVFRLTSNVSRLAIKLLHFFFTDSSFLKLGT